MYVCACMCVCPSVSSATPSCLSFFSLRSAYVSMILIRFLRKDAVVWRGNGPHARTIPEHPDESTSTHGRAVPAAKEQRSWKRKRPGQGQGEGERPGWARSGTWPRATKLRPVLSNCSQGPFTGICTITIQRCISISPEVGFCII